MIGFLKVFMDFGFVLNSRGGIAKVKRKVLALKQSGEAKFNVSEAFPERQLGESQAEKLVEVRKRLNFEIALMAFYALAKVRQGQKIHQLSEGRAS